MTAKIDYTRVFIYISVSILLFIPLLRFLYWPDASWVLDVRGYQIGSDFINVWAAPQLAFSGRLATLFDYGAYREAISALFGRQLPPHNWSYPLFSLFVYWPFAQFNYFSALGIWTISLFAAYAAVCLSQIDKEHRLPALAALALAPATLINIAAGQNGFLSAALLIGGFLVLDRRPVLAGVLFGLLTFKPQLGILIPFVLLSLRAFRTIAAACITFAILFLLSVWCFGFEPWTKYLEVIGAFQIDLIRKFQGLYVLMMASPCAALRALGLPLSISLTLQAVVTIFVIVAASWSVRRIAYPSQRALIMCAGAPLATPYAFNYDLTAISACLVWALFGSVRIGANRELASLLLWLAPTGGMLLSLISIAFIGPPVAAMLAPAALLAIFVSAVSQGQETSKNGLPDALLQKA
jgi:hypothetical protein